MTLLSGENRQNYETLENSHLHIPKKIGCARYYLRWKPSSFQEFEASEMKLLQYLHAPYELHFINGGQILQPTSVICSDPTPINIQIRTILVNKNRNGIPLLLLHGLGQGLGSMISVIKAISHQYQGPIYAIDLPGFGRSTRCTFPTSPKEIEDTFVRILESWRSSLNLEKMIIAGLSFGGFVATIYSFYHPERIHHLILLDPWGFPSKPDHISSLFSINNQLLIKYLACAASLFNVFAVYRWLGPWGPQAFKASGGQGEKSFGRRFEIQCEAEGAGKILNEYLYHCIAGNASGETAFRLLMNWIVYAKEPLCHRLYQLNMPLTMFYPDDTSFLPGVPKNELTLLVGPNCRLNVHTLPSTSHETILFVKELEQDLCRAAHGENIIA